jgi:hypothetical protein
VSAKAVARKYTRAELKGALKSVQLDINQAKKEADAAKKVAVNQQNHAAAWK